MCPKESGALENLDTIPCPSIKDERIANWRENYIYRLPSGEVVTIYDVTERKRAEEAIQKSRQKWLTTFNAIADAVFLFDEKGRIIQHKHAFETFCGKPTDEIDGRYCYDVMHGTTYPFDGCPYMKARISRQRESLELKFADRWFVATVDPVLSDNDEISGGVHLLIDIWERKLVEEACGQVNKKLNLLSSITWHDINNHLIALEAYIQLSEDAVDNPSK